MKERSLPADNLNRTVDLAEARSRHNLGARRFAVACLVLGLGLVASVVLATGIGRMDVDIRFTAMAGEMEHLERILEQFEDYCVVTQSVQTGFPVGVTVHDGAGVRLK